MFRLSLYQKAMRILQNRYFLEELRIVTTQKDFEQLVNETEFFTRYDEKLKNAIEHARQICKRPPNAELLLRSLTADASEKTKIKRDLISTLPKRFQIQHQTKSTEQPEYNSDFDLRDSSELPLPDYPGDLATASIGPDSKFSKEQIFKCLDQWTDLQFADFCNNIRNMELRYFADRFMWATDVNGRQQPSEHFFKMNFIGSSDDDEGEFSALIPKQRRPFQTQIIEFLKAIFQKELEAVRIQKALFEVCELARPFAVADELFKLIMNLHREYNPTPHQMNMWLMDEPEKLAAYTQIADDYFDCMTENEPNEQPFDEPQEDQTFDAKEASDLISNVTVDFECNFTEPAPDCPGCWAQACINEQGNYDKHKYISLINGMPDSHFEILCDEMRTMQMFFDCSEDCWVTENWMNPKFKDSCWKLLYLWQSDDDYYRWRNEEYGEKEEQED
jgi:hypothetical protein